MVTALTPDRRMGGRLPRAREHGDLADEGSIVTTVASKMFGAGLLVLIAALAAAPVARAADYWVAPGGSDADAGGAPAQAWATLVHAAGQVAAGDTVHVQAGAYGGFYLDSSGAPGAPITFVAEGGPVSISSDNPVTPDGFNIEGADYIVIDGFTVNARTRAGIRAALSNFVTIRNCSTGNNGRWGIFTGFTDDLVVENNEAYGSVDEHGIYVSNSSDRAIIRDNVVHDNNGNGIHLNGDASQGGDGLISNVLIERNVIYGNGRAGGSGINCDGVTDSVIRNNLLYDNHASGISLYHIDAAAGASGNLVVNNTIHNAADARWCININSGSTGNTVANNILYNEHPFRGTITIDSSSRSGFSANFNSGMDRYSIDGDATVIGLTAWQAQGYGASSFAAAPAELFVSPGFDYHLLASGPAVDAGTSIGAPADDLDGGVRPVGAGVDLGSYEMQLLECGDGGADPGEQCGEPGLSCSDPCTGCVQCVCALTPPVCGDGLLCGGEQCESDGDCGPAQVCTGCACVNPSVCNSGITIERPKLKLRANSARLSFKGRLVIPQPWTGIDPANFGIRFVIDHAVEAGVIDVSVPGGALWKVNGAGSKWSYRDRDLLVAGIKKVSVRDRSSKTPGELAFAIKGLALPGPIPTADAVRAAVVLGDAAECGALQFNSPGGSKPRCKGDASRMTCN